MPLCVRPYSRWGLVPVGQPTGSCCGWKGILSAFEKFNTAFSNVSVTPDDPSLQSAALAAGAVASAFTTVCPLRLDPALLWRKTHRTKIRLRRTVNAGTAAFESWNAYVTRSKFRIRTINAQILEARKALIIQTQKIAEARRNLRILENLKKNAQSQWTKGLDRETEAFAAEAFLAGIAREHGRDQRREASLFRATIEKRMQYIRVT